MKKYLLLVVACTSAFYMAGCGKAKDTLKSGMAKSKGNVLARVGNDVITLDEFNKKLNRLPEDVKVLAQKNKAAYLDNLILENLLYREALKKGLDKDRETRELFAETKKKILISRLTKDEIDDKVNITDNDIRGYYEKNEDKFMSPRRYKASHILVDTQDEAMRIVDRLNAGELFGELARKYSKDTTGKRGGDVGYFTAGEMLPAFEDECMKLKVGEVSGPVKTEYGYHIIKLTDIKDPELMSFEAVKDQIQAVVRMDMARSLFDGLISRLKAGTSITINSDLIAPEVSSGVAASSGGEDKTEKP